MCRKVLHLLILVTHSCLAPVAKDLCPKSQKAFRGSCYEFVGLQRSFSSAQAWCEQSGGHLAFIPDEDIQHFMQRHLDPGKDVWFGVAPSASTHLQYSPTAEGLLSWLDGSHITYSNWVSSPQQGAACGHILKDSGFKWEAVKDCNKRLHFICQFESGSSIVCAGRNTTLQCASGQVLMIDAGFYGHNNHHCRSSLSPSITSEHQCGRVDVVESLSAHCHGRQVCQVAEVFNTFGEPCPELGSYLSVDYHCKAGLTLTMSTVAVVFNDIHISVKWLLDLPCGNNCRLSTGDGHVIYLDPERLENGVVHKYMHPRAFVVAVECIGNGIHITVQKIITIQEPVTQIGVIGCYAGNLFFRAPNCKALYGEPFQIQMEIKAGTNVTYRIRKDKMLLSSLSVVKGNVPHNITLTRKMVKHLGPGCHQLTLYAFNMVTFPEVSTDLQVCVLEKVAGLQASVLSERNDCIDTPEIMIGVFLERGAPVLLLFSMTGYNNSSFSETREMNTRKEIFLIPQQIQGTVQVKLRAWNVFSFLEVDLVSSCGKDSAIKQNGPNGHKHLGFHKRQDETKSCYQDAKLRPLQVKQNGGTEFTVSQNDIKKAISMQQNITVVIYSGGIAPIYTTYTINTSPSTDSQGPNPITTTKQPVFSVMTTKAGSTGGKTTTAHPDTITANTANTGTTSTRHTTSPATTLDNFSCSISPSNGTVLDAFKITCQTSFPCPKCHYCFKIKNKYRRCGTSSEQSSVFLPLGDKDTNYSLLITATVQHGSFVARTSVTTQVKDSTAASADVLGASVESVVGQLKDQGLLSGETVGQLMGSVASELNSQSSESTQADRQKLRGLMLNIMTDTVKEAPINSPQEVQAMAGGLSALVQNGNELSSSAQEQASLLFVNLSSSILYMDVNKTEENEINNAANLIVEGASNILDYSSNKNISAALLNALYNIQSALLAFKDTNEEPTIIQQDNIAVFVMRVNPGSLNTTSIHIPNCTCPSFSLPTLPSTLLPSEDPVDIRMLSLNKNPFSWNGSGNISGPIGGLTLTTTDGSSIPVEKLSKDIEILLPKPVGEQVNISILDLGNYSTTIIDVPSADDVLLLKMIPSKDPLPFKLFLGYMAYPTETNYGLRELIFSDEKPQTPNYTQAQIWERVIITLLGTEGNSEPHHLTDQKKRLFERGAVDVFLLTTPFSLGELQAIRLWHNNSGRHPAWFVGNVVVQDLQTNQKWHFLCNSWLAIDMGACSLDKVFPVSTEMDLKRFSNLFFMKATKDFSDGHLWYSVINRPPSSTFTCVQRVSCCFSLLLCTMLTSVMFYGIPKDPSEQVMDLGQFEFTWQQFMVGVQSSLIMFPVNFLIVTIFRQTCPREMSCCKRKTGKAEAPSSQTATTNMSASVTLDSIINDITRIAHSLSKNVKSNIPCQLGPGQQVDISDVLSVVENFIRQNNKVGENTQKKTKSFSNGIQPQIPESSDNVQAESTVGGIQKKSNKTQYLYRQLCHIHKQLSLLGPSGFPTPHGYNQALQQVQRMKGALEDRLFTSNIVNLNESTQTKLSPADGSDGNQKKKQCCHGGLPWWFIFVGWLLVIATSFVAGFFTMLYGLKFGKPRSISWLVSMIVSFFQSVLIIQPLKVLCLAVFFALVIKKVDENDFENVAPVRNYTHLGHNNKQQAVKQNRNLYEPPPVADIEKMKKNKIMEQKAYALFREILIYLLSMCMLLLAAYAKRDPSAFYLNQHILNSFTGQLSSCMSIGDVFAWANKSLLSNLFGVYPGFITDGNSKLVGNARLRQLRVRQNSCQTAGPMQQFVPDCNALYSWEVEDMGSYNPGWNHSLENNMSTTTSSPWKYQTQAQLRAYHIWGTLALYRGGGFVTELGPDLQNASSTLEYLFSNQWLDAYTRAIFVEFTVFNANVNLFCIVTLLLETPAIGAFQFNSELHSVSLYQSGDGLHLFVVAAQIIYLLFTLYYMFLQCKLMKQQRWAYFRNKWHLLELAIILLSWSAVGVFIKMILLGNRDMTFYQNHKNQFASFYGTAKTDSQLQYLIAFLVLLCSVKLWHLLRLNPNMYMITSTLQRAWSDISSFLVVIVVMFLAYSTVSNVIYGWKLPSYRTLEKTLLTLVGMQIGIFNYDEVLDYTPLLGGFIFGSCVVFMTFVVLNLLISVILVSFNQERIYHKPSEEEEIVDLMLKKICSLFGIRYKDTKKLPGA
ncbi:LOW QUALITY PROTEIN: polycystic kidney disease protein 1-like 2 [Anabas testudineus]|uniref:LOW QUALITY PROTEIN: polycystic kidney disease protein 1-like 2 n=1 Tax=Anabas testudineus TaxID=64144 RepID=UPI000E465B68|nr:LOW QUALITY PROTEIN: polycystic kidney disease protein 1-like 2 [Anabas testudineus]